MRGLFRGGRLDGRRRRAGGGKAWRRGAVALVLGLVVGGSAWAGDGRGVDAGASTYTSAPARVLFGGDTYFGETYVSGREALRLHGYDRGPTSLAPFLAAADHVVLNLEAPVTSRTESPLDDLKPWVHAGHPAETPRALVRAGVDAVSLANNHGMDHGAPGLAESLEALAAHDLVSFGAGPTSTAAARPATFSLGGAAAGRRLHVLGAFQYTRYHDATLGFYAGPDRPGVNGWTDEAAARQVRALRARDPGSLIVAFPHWGANYAWRTSKQARLARVLVDAGVDLVLGHGAHQLQEIRRVAGRWVVYSLGNFVFQTSGRFSQSRLFPYGLVALLEVGAAVTLRLYPIRSDNRATGFRPAPIDDVELVRVHDALVERGMRGALAGRDRLGPYLELEIEGREPPPPATLGP